jgi:2'-5' RNA ligase
MSETVVDGEPRTALVALVPEAEQLVQAHRDRHDPTAKTGMPAHVTVLYPWLPVDALDAASLADLDQVLGRVSAFHVTFGEFGRFPRTLWLAPRPAEPFLALTGAVTERWPECPPYGGEFESVVPHLTVGDAVDPDALADVVADVAPGLPVTSRIEEVALMTPDGGGYWQQHSRHLLDTAA